MAVERAVPGDATWAELAAPHLARYLFAAAYAQGVRALDAGTGSGYGARLLKQAGATQVTAIDIDPAAIAHAQRHFAAEGLNFLVDDCQGLERTGGPFDLICNFENIEHLPEPERFLAAAARHLAPDGLLIVSSPDRAASPAFIAGRPRNPFHHHEWYRHEFQALLQRHFAAVDLRVQVESTGMAARRAAVAALREGLLWCNPLAMLLWRKLPWATKAQRGWKRLDQLAAAAPADFPVVEAATAELWGRSAFHVALCRQPRLS